MPLSLVRLGSFVRCLRKRGRIRVVAVHLHPVHMLQLTLTFPEIAHGRQHGIGGRARGRMYVRENYLDFASRHVRIVQDRVWSIVREKGAPYTIVDDLDGIIFSPAVVILQYQRSGVSLIWSLEARRRSACAKGQRTVYLA